MAKVYVLSHGVTRISHRFGSSGFSRKGIKAIYDSEEKVIDYIRRNVENDVRVLSSQNEFDEFPTIENFEESTKLIYAMASDDYATEYQYYIYETYDVL